MKLYFSLKKYRSFTANKLIIFVGFKTYFFHKGKVPGLLLGKELTQLALKILKEKAYRDLATDFENKLL